MNRLRSLVHARRTSVIAGAFAALLLVAAAGVAGAASGVSITESANQYHFTPSSVSVSVGDTVTWTDNTDASHTISSDTLGGPLSGAVNPSGTYHVTFTKAGTFAYHCNIHTYMHGTIHVTALPPTDAADTAGNTGLLVGLAALGSLVIITGLGFRLRRREVRA